MLPRRQTVDGLCSFSVPARENDYMQATPLDTQGASEIRRAGVDLNGLMTVLGKHLYSTPVVALRELVQIAGRL